MFRANEAGNGRMSPVLVSPVQDCLDGFRRIALTVFRWVKNPARFRHAIKRSFDMPVEIGET